MTKPKAAAATKAAAKPAPATKAARPPAVNKHAGHLSIDSLRWSEAKGVAIPFRQCSCGARLPLEG